MTNEAGLEFEGLPSDAQRQAALNEMRMVEEMGEKADFKMHACVAVNHWHIFKRALQSPRIPVIEGLEEALKKYSFDMPDMSDYESVGHYLDDIAEYRKASSIVEKAARAYAELQKGGLR